MFADRSDAGRRLAERLDHLATEAPVVLALPRGGVVVGFEIAARLGAPLDLVLVRKLGAPIQPELAVGAVVEGDPPVTVRNDEIIVALGLAEAEIEAVKTRELAEMARRRAQYLAGRPRTPVTGRTAILVDDGIATGATVRAAIRGVRAAGPRRLVLAVPVAPPDSLARLAREVDETVCLATPAAFGAIGFFYQDFSQVEDDEVIALLDRAVGFGPAPVR